MNINTAQATDLRPMLFLNALQIDNLLSHREKYGNFQNVYDLQAIPGFNLITLQKLIPLIKISAIGVRNLKFGENFKKGYIQEFLFRSSANFQKASGYQGENPIYLGSPTKMLGRYKLQNNVLKFSLVYEKDAGESLNLKYNHTSWGLQLLNLGIFNKIVLGDYHLKFGQGLSLWSGFNPQYNNQIGQLAKTDLGLSLSSSATEFGFLKGLATEMKLSDNLALTSFFSIRKLDATLGENEYGTGVQTFLETGLKRSIRERLLSKNVSQRLYGLNLNKEFNNFKIGVNLTQTSLDKPQLPANLLYKKFDFIGSILWNTSLYYDFRINSKLFTGYSFGEIAYAVGQSGANAQIYGLLLALNKHVDMGVVWRNYEPAFNNFYSAAIATSSIKNEHNFTTLMTYT
ncbi:MAG: helix-hairpin-helix domain-containing protein [Pedobacter sp.]|nr:MAG: helix-hairpin-helix domain-containing protein [Pedobacter sp.]